MPRNEVSAEKQYTYLLQYRLAIELWRGGLSQEEIGARLGIATATVNKMLRDVQREVRVVLG